MSAKAKNKLTPQQRKATLNRVLHKIRPYSAFVVCSLLVAAVSVAAQLYIPILCGDAIDKMLGKGNVDLAGVLRIAVSILVVAAVAALAQWLLSVCNNRITFSVSRDLRNEALRKIQTLPLSYLDQHSTGDIVSRVIADTDILSDGLLLGFTQLFSGIVTIVVTLIFMFSKNVWVTLLVIVLTPFSFVVAKFISSRSYTMFRKQSETRGRQTALIEEMIGGQKVVKAFGYEKESSRRFDEINKELQNYSQKAVFYSSLTNPSTRFVNNIIYAGVALLGAFLIPGGTLTVGGLSVLLAYANQYMKPFNDISSVVTEMQNALACADRIFDLLEQKEETLDAEGAFATVDGNVTIDDVAFSYDKEKELIENFNLDVKPGMRIAIVGPTGCGKTTFINLLMRFYEISGGTISIDGIDTKSVPRWNVHDQFSMVLQDTWVFRGTVRENIAYSKKDVTDEQIVAACKAVGLHHYIMSLPNGYDTVLDDKASLSQGQRQLLTIARAMVEDAPILILDEATSSVDTRTEELIQKAMDALTVGRTSFVIAHRLSTIRDADMILVMNGGDIVERGTHEELLAKSGFYADIYNSQFTLAQ